MPSKPSRADEELAALATAAGVSTSADQVRELHERKVLPEKVVPRRGRGTTVSCYPKGALTVLVTVRQVMREPGRGRLHVAVPIAWARGANVRSDALRDALLRMAGDAPRAFLRRPHRRSDDEVVNAFVPDPKDRQAFLQSVAGVLAGDAPSPGAARSLGAHLLDTVHKLALPSARQSKEIVPAVDSAHLGRMFTGAPLPGEAVIDLQATALRATIAAVLPERRKTLDRLRDRVRTQYPRLDDAAVVGMVLGALHGHVSLRPGSR